MRQSVGYQGGGPDLAATFEERLAAVGGRTYRVADLAAAVDQVSELARAVSARRVLLGHGPLLDLLPLADRLVELNLEVVHASQVGSDTARDVFFAADIGISGVDYLVAETGSMVLRARRDNPRSLSLLPPVFVAVAGRSQVLPDLFDLFTVIGPGPELASGLTLITGPSKTGDIELRLVTGVHGPGDIHVVVVESA
ncbi:MAG: lactate utilization protein [Gemmataceae bacterium]|nr:lactate utilization protein [Gemmataceae bacterium]